MNFPTQKLIAITLLASHFALAAANELVPAGTLRAAYIGQNPVQAFIDPATGEVRVPA